MYKKEEIIKYYEDCEIDYKMLWRLDKCYAMHFGYFEKGDFSLSKAILRMNDQILKYIDRDKELLILDAGCGLGGTSIYLAERSKAKFEGVTIIDSQIDTGNKIIKSLGLEDRIRITNQDFTMTNFANDTFDAVFGIESVCHANKEKFLNEAYRVLKPGGILILLDGFNTKEKEDYTEKENSTLFKMNNGWKVDSLETSNYFINTCNNIGFKDIKFTSLTEKVRKASIILYIASFPAVIVDRVGRLLKRRTAYNSGNVKTARNQHIAMKKDLWEYGEFVAEK